LYNPSNYLSIFNHAYKKALKAILDSIQIHGGIDFTTDLDLHLHLKRVILLQKNNDLR
ncbi:MAG: acyl-CoA dehydrogenase, partial [Saccharolobus sp.]